MIHLNKYGEKVLDKFLDKCKANGSYKRVYEDFEDGTCLLEDTVENLYDACAWLYLTYDAYVFSVLREWETDGCQYVFGTMTFEKVIKVLDKMCDDY